MSSWHLPAEVSKSGSKILGSAPGNRPGVHRPQRQLVLVNLKQKRSFPWVLQQEAQWEIELWHEWNTRSPSPPAYADLGLAVPICIFITISMRETGLRPVFPCHTALTGNSICHGDQLHLLFIYQQHVQRFTLQSACDGENKNSQKQMWAWTQAESNLGTEMGNWKYCVYVQNNRNRCWQKQWLRKHTQMTNSL